MKNKINIDDNLIAELRKRRGVETAGFAGTLSKTTFDKCFYYDLVSLKEEATILSVASSTRIEGSKISNDGVRKLIIKQRLNKVVAHLTTMAEKRLAILMAYKPGLTIEEMIFAGPRCTKYKVVEPILNQMLMRNVIVKWGTGYKLNN